VSELIWPEPTQALSLEDRGIRGMIELPDSNLLLTVGAGLDYLVKMDQNANILWIIDNLTYVKAMVASGNRLMACYNKDGNIVLASINMNGTFAWERTYGGTGSESNSNFIELPDRGFYIFGKTSNYTGRLVRGYDSDYDCNFSNPERVVSEYFIKTDSLGHICE
jgi:hypothetical protein